MNEMRKLMESINESYFGKNPKPSQKGEMTMDEIDALAKKRGLTNDDVWKATILAHDAGKFWDMELEVRDDSGDVYGRFPSIQDIPTFVKHPKTGKELEADVDHIYIIYKTNPEQVNAMFDWYESEAKAEHQRKQDEKEHEQFYQWMEKNPFEGLEEGFLHEEDSIGEQIKSLLAHGKKIISRLAGASGEIIDIEFSGPFQWAKLQDRDGVSNIRVDADPRLELIGTIDHYALVRRADENMKTFKNYLNEGYFSRLDAALDELVANNPNLSADKLVAIARSKYGQEAATFLSNKLEAEADLADFNNSDPQPHLREYEEEQSYDDFVDYYVGDLSRSIVRKGVFKDLYKAAGEDIDVLNAAIKDEAYSIADSYYGSGEGIGTSDMNHFIAAIGRSLGVDDVFGWDKKKESIEESDEDGINTPELFDKLGFHTKVRKGKFMPNEMLDGKVALHDLENVSPTTGEPKLVTFDKEKLAKRAAKMFDGTVVRTDIGTYRIVPNDAIEETDEFHSMMKSDDEMERDKIRRYAKYNKAIRNRFKELTDAGVCTMCGDVGHTEDDCTINENAPIDDSHFQDNLPDEGDLVRIEGGEYDGQRGTVLNIQGDHDEEGYAVLTHTIKLQSGETVEVEVVETHFNDIYLIPVGEFEYDDEVEDEFAFRNPFEARMLELAGIPISEGTFGVYRKSKQQLDSPDGHSSSESAKVKRGGEHVTFSSKSAAEKWVKDNGKGEELFVRKVSKPVKEAKGKLVNVPDALSNPDPKNPKATSADAEKFIAALGPDDEVDDYVVDPETGEVLFEPFQTKRGEGMSQFKSARDRKENMETWVPSIYGASNQDDAWEELGDLRYGNSSAAKFYNIVWRNLGDLLGDPKDLGTDAEDWGELDYDTGYDVPVAIKRKDGKKLQEEDYDNFRTLAKLVKHATGNISLSMMGTTDKGTVARFTPTLM